MKKIILLVGIFILAVSSLLAQTPVPGNTPNPTPQQTTRETADAMMRRQADFERMSEAVSRLKNPPTSASSRVRNPVPPKAKISKEQKKLLAPNTDLNSKYAKFLLQPKTGLIRLFPDSGCETSDYIIRADAECSSWIPYSSSYSFRKRAYVSKPLSDIRLQNGLFLADGVLSQGILVNLGNVSVENIDFDTSGLKFLFEYQPKTDFKSFLEQQNKFLEGTKQDGYLYRRSLSVLINQTYALRVIAYRGKYIKTSFGRKYNLLKGDERIDEILVFRVVDKGEDGNITILWKELKRQDAPKSPENDKLSNGR